MSLIHIAINNQAVIIIIVDDQIWTTVLLFGNRNQGRYKSQNHLRHSLREKRTTNCAAMVMCIQVKFENNLLRGCWPTNIWSDNFVIWKQLLHFKYGWWHL